MLEAEAKFAAKGLQFAGTLSPLLALEVTWTNMRKKMDGSRASLCPIGLGDARP